MMSIDPTVCSPYPPDDASTVFNPAWRTETVRLLAEGIEAERAFDRLPILADALEEAGCDVPAILNHCRLCSEHHPECWALKLALSDAESNRAEANAVAQAAPQPGTWRVVADRWADRVNSYGLLVFLVVWGGVLFWWCAIQAIRVFFFDVRLDSEQ